jgi:hypothetical protein
MGRQMSYPVGTDLQSRSEAVGVIVLFSCLAALHDKPKDLKSIVSIPFRHTGFNTRR